MNTQTTVPTLLNASQVAAMLNISCRTLWRLKSAGKLPEAVRVGSSVRWRQEDLQNWIAGGCQTLESPQNVPRRKG